MPPCACSIRSTPAKLQRSSKLSASVDATGFFISSASSARFRISISSLDSPLTSSSASDMAEARALGGAGRSLYRPRLEAKREAFRGGGGVTEIQLE